MRVSSTQMIGRYQKQLNDSYEDQTKMMEQSDGSKLHRPSDDSVNYSKYLRYQNSSTENEQYQSNVKTGISWMKTADAAMVNMTDILTTLKEKTIQAANDTNQTVDVQAIGKEFLNKVYELVSLGNTQQGDRYMFSGQSDLTQPFTVSAAKKERGLTKTLDDPQSDYFKDSNGNSLGADAKGNAVQMLTLKGSDGNTYYLNTRSGNIYTEEFVKRGYKDNVANGQQYVQAGDEAATISGWSSTDIAKNFNANGVISTGVTTVTTTTFNTINGAAPTVTATTDGLGNIKYEITDSNGNTTDATLNGTTLTSDTNSAVSISNFGTSSAVFTDSNGTSTQNGAPTTSSSNNQTGKDWSQTFTIDGKSVTLKFATVDQYIVEYSGDAKHISMTKRNGTVDPTADTVNATGQDLFGSDIFDNVNSGNQPKGVSSGTAALNDLLTIVAKLEAGDTQWLSSDGITLADVAHSSVLDAQTTTAARQNVYDSVSTMLDKQNETITEDISNASDADVAKLAVMMMTMQTIYNMSLSVGSRILPQSLTDYLG